MTTTPVGSLEAQTGVLGDDVAHRVLGDDLVSIPRRRGEHVEHDVLDHVGELAELVGRTTFLDIDPNKWHESIPHFVKT